MEFTNPNSEGFTIYSKSGCSNCSIVKKIIKEKHFLLTEINCDEYILENKEGFLLFIEQLVDRNYKIFPMVFYNGKFIGGLTDTIDFIDKLLLSFEENF